MSALILMSCLPASDRTKLQLNQPLIDAKDLTSLCHFLVDDGYQFKVGGELKSCNWFQKHEISLSKRVAFFKSLSRYRTYYLEIDDDGNAYYFLRLHKYVDAVGQREIEKIEAFVNKQRKSGKSENQAENQPKIRDIHTLELMGSEYINREYIIM